MGADVFRGLLDERARAANLSLGAPLSDKLADYLSLLSRWNTRINLTSLPLDPPTPAAIDRLVVEPLLTAPLLDRSIAIWFDLGSGGGSPAIPLQLAHPAQRLILVESRDRKAAFLREAIRELPVEGAEVEVSRIEQVTARPHNSGVADLVTVRAVKASASLFSDIKALLRFRGQAVLFGASVTPADLPRGLERIDVPQPSHGLVVLRRLGL
jgi:16S rRNA (guanine527-N7)-methyltransferase